MSRPNVATPAPRAGGGIADERLIHPGRVAIRRSRRWSFPAYQLLRQESLVASFGRYSMLNIYFGPGQRISLSDGTRWRLRAIGVGGAICPIVTDADGRRISQSGLMARHYGINTPGHAYGLIRAEQSVLGTVNRWILTHEEDYVMHLTRRPREALIVAAVPLATVLLSFVLMDFGIPGEDAPRFSVFGWS